MSLSAYDLFRTSIACPDLGEAPLAHVLRTFKDTLTAGLIVECGVWTGRSITAIATALPLRQCFGFDSFEGLPENWDRPDMVFNAGAFGLGRIPPVVPENVELVPGWFDKTLPGFAAEHAGESISLLHIDCDLYSSIKCALTILRPMLKKGTIIVFDELFNYPTYEKHELLALFEFLEETSFNIRWIGKHGPINLSPVKDNGYYDQPAALQLC